MLQVYEVEEKLYLDTVLPILQRLVALQLRSSKHQLEASTKCVS